VPVYLSPPSPHLNSMVSDLRARISSGGGRRRQAGYRVEIRTPDVHRPEPAATVENYSALLAGLPSSEGAQAQGRPPLPTVVLVRIYHSSPNSRSVLSRTHMCSGQCTC